MTSGKQRVDGEPAFLLQAHPYRETSLVVDVFSREFGRIGLVARGAKRPRAALRGVLVEFQPLELGWFGQGELRTLALDPAQLVNHGQAHRLIVHDQGGCHTHPAHWGIHAQVQVLDVFAHHLHGDTADRNPPHRRG